jgi:lipopolysaccharide export system protein LptA
MILILALALAAASNPVADSGTVSSANASYDGNALVLKGQVVLDHGLGKMNADEAVLQRQEVGKEFPFSLIHLKKDVLLALKSSAELKCDTADLDFGALKGTLSAEDKVVYTDLLKRKKGPATSLRLMSHVIDLQLSKKEQENQKTLYDIAAIVAKESVLIEYANQVTLHADNAIFQKAENKLSAYPKDTASKCSISHESGAIDADAAHLDLNLVKLTLDHPAGAVRDFRFTANSLSWDHLKNILTLKDKIEAEEPSLGNILADHELQLILKGKNSVVGIKAKGKTTLHDFNAHKIVCFGTLFIDREKLHGSGESPLVEGVVPEGKQIYYEESDIALYADKAQIEYSETFQPVSLALKGNIRILSRDPEKPSRCGVADRVTYSPTTRTFILGADPGKKVLFINQGENIRISAQEVHITEDPSTKKQTVKGIGNVQLSLTTEETSLLQKIFKLPNL